MLDFEFDRTMVNSLCSAVSGMKEGRAEQLVNSIVSETEIFKPEIMILLIFVFAGGAAGTTTIDDVVGAIKQRRERLEAKEKMDSEIISRGKEDKVVKMNLGNLRASNEFRIGVYENTPLNEIERKIEEREDYEREKKDWEEKLRGYEVSELRVIGSHNKTLTFCSAQHLDNVPEELERLFAVSSSSSSSSSSSRSSGNDNDNDNDNDNKNEEKVERVLNENFTLEKAAFVGGLTAMHLACYRNDYMMIRLLKRRGNPISVLDRYKKLPQDCTRDTKSLEALGLLHNGSNKHCEMRSTLQRRIMQTVNFAVRSGEREGVATKYDMFNKSLYIHFEQHGEEKMEKIEVLSIMNLKMLRCNEKGNLPLCKLFDDIKACVNQFRATQAKILSKTIYNNVLIVSSARAADFINAFQKLAWGEIAVEVIGEFARKEASDDIMEAQRKFEKLKEEEEQRRRAEERRKEEERARAIRFKADVKKFAVGFVGKIEGRSVPWIATVLHHFNRFDIDGNGTLSAMEMIAALRTMGISKKIQNESSGIQMLITRFRRRTDEMTVKQFMEELPEEVLEAIRRNVLGEVDKDKDKEKDRDGGKAKKKVRFGGKQKGQGEGAGAGAGTAVDITSGNGKVVAVQRRGRKVLRDLPPTPEEEVSERSAK